VVVWSHPYGLGLEQGCCSGKVVPSRVRVFDLFSSRLIPAVTFFLVLFASVSLLDVEFNSVSNLMTSVHAYGRAALEPTVGGGAASGHSEEIVDATA